MAGQATFAATPSVALTDQNGEARLDIRSTMPGTAVVRATAGDGELDTELVSVEFVATRSLPAWIDAEADLPVGREDSAAVAGADGRLFVIGGVGSGELSTVEAFDPAQHAWQRDQVHGGPLASLPEVIGHPMAASGIDGRIYVAGSHSTLAYDATTNAWTQAPSGLELNALLPGDERFWARGTLSSAEGGALSWGATLVDGPDQLLYAFDDPSGTVRVYDPQHLLGSGWSPTLSPMPTPRQHLAAVTAPDGRIYVVGGRVGSSDTASVEVYNPALGVWSTVANLSVPREGLALAVMSSGNLVALGGRSQGSLTAARKMEIYGPRLRVVQGGVTAAVGGDNFAPNAVVQVYVDSMNGPPAGTSLTNSKGEMNVPVTLIVPKGAHRLIVIDDRSRYPVSASVNR
jgi:hypothetical protein